MGRKRRGPATTKNGQYVSLNLDSLSLARCAYGVEAVGRVLEIPATNSTIVRRALDVYMKHLAGILSDPNGTSSDRERVELFRANEGGDAPWEELPIEKLNNNPIPTFGQLLKCN